MFINIYTYTLKHHRVSCTYLTPYSLHNKEHIYTFMVLSTCIHRHYYNYKDIKHVIPLRHPLHYLNPDMYI